MGSTEAVYQFLAFLLFPAIIQLEECHAVSHHARSVNLSVPKTFVESIFDEYGSNNSMNSQQFNSLLEELNIGSSSNEQASENDKAKVWENYVFMIFLFRNRLQRVVIFVISFHLSPFFACFVCASLNSGRLDFCSSLESGLRSSLNRRLDVSRTVAGNRA